MMQMVQKVKLPVHNNIISGVNCTLPCEIGRNIWNRYYTYVVLGELTESPLFIHTSMYGSIEIHMQYLYLYPDELEKYNDAYEELVFEVKNKKRKRYWRLNLM